MLNYTGTVQSVSEAWYVPEQAILFYLWNVRNNANGSGIIAYQSTIIYH